MSRFLVGSVLCVSGLVLAGCDAAQGPFARADTASDEAVAAAEQPTPEPSLGPDSRTSRVDSALARTGFGQSVRIAVLSNPNLRVARAEIGVAQSQVLSADGALRPEFTAGINAQADIAGDTSTATGPFVRASQLLFDGGASRFRQAAAQAGLGEAQENWIATASDTALDAVNAHIDVYEAQAILRLARENLDAHRNYLTDMEERRTLGASSEGDLLTVQSRLADAETETLEAQANLDRARARYAEVFGQSAPTVAAPPTAPRVPQQAGEWRIATSPRMRTLDAQIAAATARRDATAAQRVPRVEVGGTARLTDFDEPDVFFDLSVNYSFDNRGAAQAALARAEAEISGLQAEKARLSRDIQRALDTLASDRVAGARRLETARAAVDANRQNVAASQDEFSIGRRTLIELLDAQRAFTQAQERVVAAEVSILQTGYEALALTGDLLGALDLQTQIPVVQP